MFGTTPQKKQTQQKSNPETDGSPSIGGTATPVWRKAQHHHPSLNQNNDKRRASHLLESDTDMLSVSGGFLVGLFGVRHTATVFLGFLFLL